MKLIHIKTDYFMTHSYPSVLPVVINVHKNNITMIMVTLNDFHLESWKTVSSPSK